MCAVATIFQQVPENIAGDFFVDSTCIDCDACRQIAPAVFAAADGHSYVQMGILVNKLGGAAPKRERGQPGWRALKYRSALSICSMTASQGVWPASSAKKPSLGCPLKATFPLRNRFSQPPPARSASA